MKFKHTLLATAIATASMGANADLFRQGPINPANGFPTFYQDASPQHIALDLCLPNAAELADGTCLLLPADIPNSALPIAFPGNFPEEAFWFNANTSTPLGGVPGAAGNALLVMGLEAAFGVGPVAVGDQIVFSRIRYKFTAPVAGDYTVTTPYTVDGPFHAEAGELVFNTLDIGVACAKGDFSCAMKGKTAPFLRAASDAVGTLAPFHLANGNTYLADPAVDTFVTGGPIGNVFTISVVDDATSTTTEIANTDQFSLMGKVHTGPLPSFTTLDRATYARDINGTQVDVYATSVGGFGAPAPNLQLLADNAPGTLMKKDDASDFKFHAHLKPNDGNKPTYVSVSNVTDVPPTVQKAALTDLVQVSVADYAGGVLTVSATSSDTAVPQTLTVTGSNDVVYGTIENSGGTLAVPAVESPDTVTVSSTADGKATVPVTTDATPVDTPTIANPDPLLDGASLVNIPVLANDEPLPFGPRPGTSVHIVRSPSDGTVIVNNDNTVSYSANAGFGGDTATDSFTYYIDNGVNGLSNIATVSFKVPLTNRAPVANPDTFSAARNAVAVPLSWDVLINDTDPDNQPLSVIGATLVNGGTGTVGFTANRVTYTPPAVGGATGQIIDYTLSDNNGGTVTGHVTVNLVSGEAIPITGTPFFKVSTGQWDIQGTLTTNPATTGTGTVITMYVGNGAVKNASTLIGTAVVDATGRWRLPARPNNPVVANGTNQVYLVSSRGFARVQNHVLK
jgi:Bacterial Ig domain